MQILNSNQNFLGLTNPIHFEYDSSQVVVQSLPYEYSSSYHKGSYLGPSAILKASHFVEFYDEELDKETCFKQGICTIKPLDFENIINEEAIDLIYKQSQAILKDDKFLVSLGAEHTISYGVVKAIREKYKSLSILQIDAHSDLRNEYEGSIWSHASVMARINEFNIPISQVGIRALCKEEANLIKESDHIHTAYAHQIRNNTNWIENTLSNLTDHVYITIDADGFDPSIMPAVGTAEPNGLFWDETIALFKRIFAERNVVAFDIVECAPRKIDTLTEFSLAKLAYKLIGLKYK